MSEETGQSAQRIAHLAALRAAGVDPYRIERYARTHMTARIQNDFEALDGADVAVAGRLMALRSQGKTTFAEIEDASGRIQLYARVNDLGDAYQSFVDLEAGDIVGASGKVFRTRRGEITIDVRSFSLLAKCLHVPPIGKERDGERFAGLKDPEIRHRMRYVDLLSNPDVREIFLKRSAVLRAVRGFLDAEGFAEVETPVLQDVAGGAAARPFITRHNDLKRDFKLRISLELPLKRLIVGGIERVYEIGRVFRNESADTRHNPEFTLLELYQAYADLDDIMDLVERMYVSVSQAVLGTTELTIGDRVVDLGRTPWRRLPMLEGIREYGGIDPAELQTFESARDAGLRAGARVGKEETLGGVIEELHETFTQPNLIEPTFITDFPVDVSPLAKRRADNPTLARRFEVYLGAQELGNAFSELNDPMEQRERFLEQVAMRDAGDDEAHPMDEDYIRALEYGMPPTGGLGIGIDRLVMILTGAPSIRDVILFPALRTERGH